MLTSRIYRKLMLVALVCTLPTAVMASADKYMESLHAWVNAGCSIVFEFTAVNRNGKEVLSYGGTLDIKNDAYALAVPGAMKVISNGKEKIMINEETKEAMLAANNASSRDLLENPLQIAFDYDKSFKLSNGKDNSVELEDKNTHSAYPKICIWFKPGSQEASWVPQKFEIEGKDGSIYTVIVKSFSSPMKISGNEFDLNPGKLAGYQLIDLR